MTFYLIAFLHLFQCIPGFNCFLMTNDFAYSPVNCYRLSVLIEYRGFLFRKENYLVFCPKINAKPSHVLYFRRQYIAFLIGRQSVEVWRLEDFTLTTRIPFTPDMQVVTLVSSCALGACMIFCLRSH